MSSLLNRQFRETSTRKSIFFSILAFGLFIFLFLYLFKPFGLAQLKPLPQLFITMGFGIITGFVLIIIKFLIEPLAIQKTWTLGKHILWDIFVASSIGVANYFYICIVFKLNFTVIHLLYSIWTAILVGSIPVTISYFIAFNRIYRNALKESAVSQESILWDDEVIITAGYPRNDFRINPKNIVYLCSNDNYVTIVTNKDNVQNKMTIRGTLKTAERELKNNSRFIRCHKCYIVNLDFVEKVTGNNQNMKIKLSTAGNEIPVARSRADEVSKRTEKALRLKE
jgi:hypothetical protein